MHTDSHGRTTEPRQGAKGAKLCKLTYARSLGVEVALLQIRRADPEPDDPLRPQLGIKLDQVRCAKL